ncbi:MAG: hypothetical protein OXI92_05805, partial [Acidobacteriota bacterium]|nr:hypothetical protein [Acidobacteriota bacterium]
KDDDQDLVSHAPPCGSSESETPDLHGLILNMDAQDAQDIQDGRLLHERLTPAMIVCGFADCQDCKAVVSRKNPVHPVHPC